MKKHVKTPWVSSAERELLRSIAMNLTFPERVTPWGERRSSFLAVEVG